MLCDPNQRESAILAISPGRHAGQRPDAHRDPQHRGRGVGRSPKPRLKPGSHIAIALSDTGSGMPPDLLAQALDPFITGYAETAAFRNGHPDQGMPMIAQPFSAEALATRIRQPTEM